MKGLSVDTITHLSGGGRAVRDMTAFPMAYSTDIYNIVLKRKQEHILIAIPSKMIIEKQKQIEISL